MITSALIKTLRREVGDNPKSTQVIREGNAVVNLFNLGKFPVVEGSYSIFKGTSALTETTHYTLDKDNGDLRILTTPGNGVAIKSQHKYAFWRDQNWNDAINSRISELNARGFFRQHVRIAGRLFLSAGVQSFSGPSACIDLYELLVPAANGSASGQLTQPYVNWSYQQDANKVVLGQKPSTGSSAVISYLRNLQTYEATSATLDLLPEWVEVIDRGAQADFYRALAGKVAKEGNASIDEGHFSFTNLRTMANDLENEFQQLALRKKPTRPAKDMQFFLPTGGTAG